MFLPNSIHLSVPLQIQHLTLGAKCFVYVTETTTETQIREYCKALSVLTHNHYTVSKTRHVPNEFLVHRMETRTRTIRSEYPYATIEVNESFRIPVDAEPNEGSLRVHTCQLGNKLGKKFGLYVSKDSPEYIILRKA